MGFNGISMEFFYPNHGTISEVFGLRGLVVLRKTESSHNGHGNAQ